MTQLPSDTMNSCAYAYVMKQGIDFQLLWSAFVRILELLNLRSNIQIKLLAS